MLNEYCYILLPCYNAVRKNLAFVYSFSLKHFEINFSKNLQSYYMDSRYSHKCSIIISLFHFVLL